MGNTKKMLELFSFEIDEQSFHDEQFYTIQMPDAWHHYFESKRKDYGNYQMTMKPRDVEPHIYGLFQNVFHISWKNSPWLLLTEKIDVELLKEICLSWFAKQEGCPFNELPMALQQVELEQVLTTFSAYKQIHPETNIMYQWIPSLMAKRVERMYEGESLTFIQEQNIRFHHLYFNGQHECMSTLIQPSEKQDPFAYSIRFELKTRGLKPEAYIINVSFHIRRFLVKSVEEMKAVEWARASSMIASFPNPFTNETKQKLITLAYKRNKDGVNWASEVDQLFLEFSIKQVDPEEVLKNPIQYINHDPFKLMVVYNAQTFKRKIHTPKVLAGIGLPEKIALFEDMKMLFPELNPLRLLPEEKKIRLGNKVEPIMHYGDIDDKIRFEVWGGDDFFGAIKEVLTGEKGLLTQTEDANYFLLNDNKGTCIEMVHLNHIEIIAAMPKEQGKREEKRIEEVSRLAPVTPKIILAMVEIQPANQYFPKITDPKNAIRQGLGRRNRLTQFVYPISENQHEHRIHSGFRDLLTDYGYLPHFSKKLERDDLFLSVDLLQMKKGRKNIYIPLITKLVNRQLYVKFLGDRDWYLFRDALIRVTQITLPFLEKMEKDVKRFRSFLKRTIEEELRQTDCKITLIVDAVLRSGGWYDPIVKKGGWLNITNEDLIASELPFHNMNETWQNRVRVVRVNSTNDNPQYQIVENEQRIANRKQGLFYDDHGIYYSIGNKPSTIRAVNKLLKYDAPNKLILKQNIVELIPLGVQDTTEAHDLAEYVHYLRPLVIGYDAFTIKPYPLHMGRKIKQYLEKADISAYEDWKNRAVESTVIFEE